MTSSLKNQRELQIQAQQILSALRGIQVPVKGLNDFTVGDKFRENLFKRSSDIENLLNNENQFLESIIIGGFGSGKTHFLNYLDWILQRDTNDNCVISRVDLSKLREPHELQFHIIKGMRPLHGGTYKDVLMKAYQNMRNHYVKKYLKITESDIQKIYGSILFSILGQVPYDTGWIRGDLSELIGKKGKLEKILQKISGKTLQKLFNEDRKRSDREHVDFVDTYINLIENPNAPISRFEEPARNLSYAGNLTDVIFKVLKFSGVKTIIIMIDELESLSRLDSDLKKALVSIRDFRDTFSKVHDEFGYPPIACFFTSTDKFFNEKIANYEPALYSRWELLNHNVILEPMSCSDVDNLIFRLKDLYYLAGYDLRAVKNNSEKKSHEVIEMRDRIFQENSIDNKPISSRKMLKIIIKEIEKTWLN